MINSVSPDLNTIKDAEPLARLQLQKRMTEQTMPLSFAGETDPPTRQDRVRRALFRGESLRLLHLHYRHLVWALATLLLEDEWNPHDLTNIALAPAKKVEMAIIAHERGVVAGVAETAWLFGQFGLDAESKKTDGDMFGAGDTLLRIQETRERFFRWSVWVLIYCKECAGSPRPLAKFKTRSTNIRRTLWSSPRIRRPAASLTSVPSNAEREGHTG